MRNQVFALTTVAMIGSSTTVLAADVTYQVNGAAYAAPSPLVAQSEERARPERGERRSSAAAKEWEICKEIRLVDRGHPGKGDAVYETVTVECPADRSENMDAPQAKLCGQTILVKRGYLGQGEEVLESVKVRCPEDQSALPPDTHGADADRETRLCKAHTLVKRGDPGQGADLFRTVLVDCPADLS